MKKQAGISLSEVLISLLLSSLMVTILIQFYLSNKRHYLKSESMLTASLDLHWVSALLSDSIRRAGFTPCLSIDQLNFKKQGQIVHGFQIENESQQALQINRMHEHFAKVLRIQNRTQILVPRATVFNEKRSLLIANCEHAELKRILKMQPHASGVQITLDSPLQFSYTGTVYVGEYLEERWFIKKNTHGDPSLFYKLVQAEEITPIIQSLSMQLQQVQDKVFIKVTMGLLEGKTRSIRVAVRNS